MCQTETKLILEAKYSTRGSTMNKKGTMSSNRALRRAKGIKQSEVLMYIEPFFRSSHVFPLKKFDDGVHEKKTQL